MSTPEPAPFCARFEPCGNCHRCTPPPPPILCPEGHDQSAGRWCGICGQLGSHHTPRHDEFVCCEPLVYRYDPPRGDTVTELDTTTAGRLADLSAVIRQYLMDETDCSSASFHATVLTQRIAARVTPSAATEGGEPMTEHTVEIDAPVKPTGLVRIDSWKVVCQECYDEFENHNGWSIFGDHGFAVEGAQDADWLVRNGLTLCPACWEKKPYCHDEDNECVRRDVSEADDGWLYCPDHIEQGMDAPSVTPTTEPNEDA